LFVTLRSPKPQHLMLCSWYLWKALNQYMFIDLVWDYLELRFKSYWSLNHFFQWKLNKIKTRNFIGIWKCYWCFWKAHNKSDLIKFISQFSKLRCGKYWFLNGFCCWKFKQIAKIEFGRKIQLSLQCVHIAEFRSFQLKKYEK
jgi:hypothetical protein